MSAPSSEGRLSTSSVPSVASSPTLNSRYSGVYADNGEGSSSQRPSLAPSRQDSGGRRGVQEEESRSSGSPLGEEAIGEQDFAQRKRSRRSGGFLLDSAFPSGLRTRHAHNGGHERDTKGKQTSHSRKAHERSEHRGRHHPAPGVVTSSPLSREVSMADAGPADADRRVDSSVSTEDHASDDIHVAKRRIPAPNVTFSGHDREQHRDTMAPHPTFDPTQIVHMALSLNESRRRNLNATQLLAPRSRASSGAARDGSFHSPGTGSGHLRQYLNEQRRVSRNISPFDDRSSGRHMSMSQRRGSVLIHGRQNDPSEATWRRVEKARAFIELRMEYLRLLQFLPPLKPDSTSPGNFVVLANNVPGSPHAPLTRMPSHMNTQYELGRAYNPLQLLRNRRCRARERKYFEHPPEEFADVQEVRKWVDKVEEAAKSPSYRRLDGVALPKIHDDHERVTEPPKPSRPNKLWTFTAEELLADAHWLEHGDNKTIVEDRFARKIFPQKEPQKQDSLQPRSSKEYAEKRRKSWVEGLAGVVDSHNTTGDESEALSERGRKRRLLPTFRSESPKHKKHNWIGSKQQASDYTDSADSDSDLDKRRSRKTQKIMEEDNETGPLKLRMKQLLEREAEQAQTQQTPGLYTPDTPNKWGQHHPDVSKEDYARSSFEVSDSANDFTRAGIESGLKLPPKQRIDRELSKDPSKEYRSSFDNTTPNTPIHARHYPHIDGDLSTAPSRDGSERKKSKKGKLDFLRSEESKSHKYDNEPLRPGSAGSDKKRSSRIASEDVEEGLGIGSAIWSAQGAVKNLLGHRKNDSVNSLISPVKDSRKDIKEPHSAVSRFIKGVKHEGSKVGGFIFGKDRPADDSDTDAASERSSALESETEDELGSRRRREHPGLARSSTAETAGSTTSKKTPGYHYELPAFHSSYKTKTDGDDVSEVSDHHIARQARETARIRSPRFDKLAPPGLDLSRISSNTSQSSNQDRISRLLARPGGVGLAGLPVTGLARDAKIDLSNGQQRPTLEGKRHWSIANDQDNSLSRRTTSNIVTPYDIASVRAIFLCSGIKAKEIHRRALEVRDAPPGFLVNAAKSANASLYGVSRKEEHVLAARILVTALESSIQSLEDSANTFRETTVADLQSRMAKLKETVETDLFARVQESEAVAVAITERVTREEPLVAKKISDKVETMMRMRRRRTRFVRRVGWTVLEWVLLGFMWGIWLAVTLGKGVARVAALTWGVVRWLLWL